MTMKNGNFQKDGYFSFEIAGIRFSAVFSELSASDTEAFRVCAVTDGNICAGAEKTMFEAGEKDVLLLPPKTVLRISENGENAVALSLFCKRAEKESSEDLFPMFSKFFGAVETMRLKDAGEIARLVIKGFRISEEKEKGFGVRLETLVMQIAFELYDELSAVTTRLNEISEKAISERTKTPQLRDCFIDRYIRENFRTDITLEDLSARTGVSERQLNRIFEKNYGTTFYRYLTRLRIEEAKRLLSKRPKPSVEAVAYAVGYSTYTGFHNAFKKETGMLPGEYRRRRN